MALVSKTYGIKFFKATTFTGHRYVDCRMVFEKSLNNP